MLLDRSSHRKLALHPPSACLSKGRPHGVIGEQLTHSICQPCHIFGGNQPAGFAMFHQLWQTAHVGSHPSQERDKFQLRARGTKSSPAIRSQISVWNRAGSRRRASSRVCRCVPPKKRSCKRKTTRKGVFPGPFFMSVIAAYKNRADKLIYHQIFSRFFIYQEINASG